MRNSARKQLHNRSIKTRLHNLERKYTELLDGGKKEEAVTALRDLSSAFDKAAKTGVVNRPMVNRKKSRLSLRLKAANAPKPAEAPKPA